MTTRTCWFCKFHRTAPDHCRFNPPAVINANQSAYPVVGKMMDCSKFEPASQKQMADKHKSDAEYQKKLMEAQAQAAPQQPPAPPMSMPIMQQPVGRLRRRR